MINIESGLYTCKEKWLNSDINIVLAGVGATGSAVASMLFKLHHIRKEMTDNEFGLRLALFDPKSVSQTGINRTGFLRSEIGQNKAVNMANKLNNAYGGVFATGFPYELERERAILRNVDVIISATDSAASRNAIATMDSIVPTKTLWLDIGVGETFGNVVLGELGKGKHRLPNVADLFPSMQGENEDKALSRASCDVLDAITRQSFSVNETGAAFGVGLLARLSLFGSITTHGCIFDVAQCRSTPINIDRTAWKSFGYIYRKRANNVV